MGLHAASEFWKPKGEKKNLTITFEGGEEIVPALKTVMDENKIKNCKIIDMEGNMKAATLDIVQGKDSKKMRLENVPIVHAAGEYKLSFGDMYGRMSVTIQEKQPRTCTLISGTADKDLAMKITYEAKNE
ncbi:MAG: hypothetical protein PHH08_00335 [Candidatus ainarchaeum sp.]|nr:hypothetical protein [Candidatus ainarchaeum sp.]